MTLSGKDSMQRRNTWVHLKLVISNHKSVKQFGPDQAQLSQAGQNVRPDLGDWSILFVKIVSKWHFHVQCKVKIHRFNFNLL